jgi:hypothetical protein
VLRTRQRRFALSVLPSQVLPTNTTLKQLYFFYLRITFQNNTTFFRPHTRTRQFFMLHKRTGLVELSYHLILKRWLNTYTFLLNLFYSNLTVLALGDNLLGKELSALNQYTEVMRPQPTRRRLQEGQTLSRRFQNPPVSTDLSLNYAFRRRRSEVTTSLTRTAFVWGLVPLDEDPWLVDYPVPTFNRSLLIQYLWIQLTYNALLTASRFRFWRYWLLWSSVSNPTTSD